MSENSQCAEYYQAGRLSFLHFVLDRLPNLDSKKVADLGSGPGELADIIIKKYNVCSIDLVDASASMQSIARNKLKSNHKAVFVQDYIENIDRQYDFVISINTAHHFENLVDFWSCFEKFCRQDTEFFIIDLVRPAELQKIHAIVKSCYPRLEINSEFYNDFYNSLRAAFSYEEIENFFKYKAYSVNCFQLPNTELKLWIVKNYG